MQGDAGAASVPPARGGLGVAVWFTFASFATTFAASSSAARLPLQYTLKDQLHATPQQRWQASRGVQRRHLSMTAAQQQRRGGGDIGIVIKNQDISGHANILTAVLAL